MAQNNISPQIQHLAWGEVDVEGHEASYKDAKLWPGGSREWNWNETGMDHTPGIKIDDVRELVEHGAEKVILSRGMNQRLQTPKSTLQWLEKRGVEFEVLPTEKAVEHYNELASQEPVGALIHSTC